MHRNVPFITNETVITIADVFIRSGAWARRIGPPSRRTTKSMDGYLQLGLGLGLIINRY